MRKTIKIPTNIFLQKNIKYIEFVIQFLKCV
jgi:hypothetical protein